MTLQRARAASALPARTASAGPGRTLLLTAGLAATLLAGAAPAAAQATGDPLNGRELFDGITSRYPTVGYTHDCSNCHVVAGMGMNSLRRLITGSDQGATTLSSVMGRFQSAVANNRGGAMSQYAALPTQDALDLAAYIADTPRTDVATLEFRATDTNAETAAQAGRFIVGATAPVPVQVLLVSLGGTHAADWVAKDTGTCTSSAIVAGGNCTASVAFKPTATGTRSATLTFQFRPQGDTATYTRTITLVGTTGSGTNPGGGTGGGGGDSGGGALGAGWLALLGAAVLAARRVRRDRA
jgi:mono/diheme cytochrome c family protein